MTIIRPSSSPASDSRESSQVIHPQRSKRQLRFNSIGTSLFLSVMGGALLGLGGISFFFSRVLEQQATTHIRETLSTEVNAIEIKLTAVKQATRDIAGSVKFLQSTGVKDSEAYQALVLEFFLKRPKLSMAAGFGQTPRAIVPDRQWYYPYFYADQKAQGQTGKRLPPPNDQVIYAELFKEDNYPTQDYYKIAASTQKEVWTEPYLWYGITMSSFVFPIFDHQRQLLGVADMDVNVTNLSKQIKSSVIRNQGYFALISEQGKLLSYPPNPAKAIARESYQTIPDLKAVLPQLQQGQSGLIRTEGNFWTYQRLPSTNWLMVAVVPESVVLRPILAITVAGTLGAGVVLAIIVLLFVQRLNRRLQPILDECNKLAEADAQTQVKMQGQDEVGRLSTSFYNLLARVAANEEQIRQEAAARLVEAQERLRLATEAQQEGEALQAEVGHILDVVSELEAGDLTVQAQVSDRATGLVADTLNRLIEELGQTMAQVLKAAQQVSQGSTALEQLAKTVANNAQQQAQEVVQVLSLTQQVEQSAQSSAVAVNMANQSLLQVRSVVEQGQVAIHNMTKGIDVLHQGTDQIIQRMKTLGEFVGLADQFVQEQSQIASLTQVLAMNATLVAARASEQRDPRQFLVVALEFEAIAAQVGTLAQQTNDGLVSLQKRTDQIHTVVSAIDAEVQSLGGLVSGFTTEVEQSNQVFANVRTTTGEVVQAGEAVAQSSQEIVNATQSTTKAMHDIADLAERTAQLTQNTRWQSEQMETLSRQLLSSIQVFRLPVAFLNQLPTDLSSVNALGDRSAEATKTLSITATPVDNRGVSA